MKIPFTVLWASVTLAGGETLLNERFASDPTASRALISGDSSRFSFNPSAKTLTASYDLLQPHARIAWPLRRTLSETDSFAATVEFTLSSINFDDFNFCQLSFGLINAANTGTQRTIAPGNSWECLTVDYFPGASYPTYTPTFISQDDGSGNALTSDSLKFPDGATSLINDFGEIGPLPADTRFTTVLSYEASTRTITLRLSNDNGGLPINKFGANPDNDPSTIQLILTEELPFRFDAFALLLWQHNQPGSADLDVHSIHVKTSGINLIQTAFPDGIPSPVFENGVLSITYRHNLTNPDITIFAEISSNLENWKRVPHTLIFLGEEHEIRKVETTESFLRFNVNYP